MGKPAGPKILFYDIETSPLLAYVWGAYQQNIIRAVKDREILCFAYKWFGSSKIYFESRQGKRGLTSERALVSKLWDLIDKADIVLGYNSESFDNKVADTKFLIHNLGRPSPYKSIDPCRINRRKFKFTTNKYENVCRELGIVGKVKHRGFDMWEEVMRNDPRGWEEMKKYNMGDIPGLEQIYLRIRPWIDSHPHIGLLTSALTSCPSCGSDKIQSRGCAHTRTAQYTRYQCCNCGSWSRGKARTKTRVETV